jgi:PncC family amidohydrolase
VFFAVVFCGKCDKYHVFICRCAALGIGENSARAAVATFGVDLNKKSCKNNGKSYYIMLENEIINKLKAAGLKLVTAESCTAGLLAGNLANVPGASSALWGGYVTYAPEAKETMLGIERGLLEKFGAVSRETACAMAQAALDKSSADVAVSVTGLAGPDGDGSLTPVGTVWIGVCQRGGAAAHAMEYHFGTNSDRAEIRSAARSAALEAVNKILQEH